MKKFLLSLQMFCLMLLLSCGTGESTMGSNVLRPAFAAPDEFEAAAGMSLDDDSCKSPLIDPQDNTRIIMFRSGSGSGDYEVPEGKYGVRQGELLRVNCETGEVIGIVRK